jgi:acyl-CoA synthetase (AMP-forming)/AMP-acid ligase II
LNSPSLAVANVGALVSRASRAYARQIAIKSPTRSITYEELDRRSNRLANALLATHGLARGARVGVCLPNCIEVVELELACYKAALVKAPINARLSPVEVAAMIANSEAELIVTTAARAEAFLPLLQTAAPRLLLVDQPDGSAHSYEAALAAASDTFEAARVQRTNWPCCTTPPARPAS